MVCKIRFPSLDFLLNVRQFSASCCVFSKQRFAASFSELFDQSVFEHLFDFKDFPLIQLALFQQALLAVSGIDADFGRRQPSRNLNVTIQPKFLL